MWHSLNPPNPHSEPQKNLDYIWLVYFNFTGQHSQEENASMGHNKIKKNKMKENKKSPNTFKVPAGYWTPIKFKLLPVSTHTSGFWNLKCKVHSQMKYKKQPLTPFQRTGWEKPEKYLYLSPPHIPQGLKNTTEEQCQ